MSTFTTFAAFVQHGRDTGGNIVNGMPWSFRFQGYPVSHETDTCYLITTPKGTLRLTPNSFVATGEGEEIRVLQYAQA